MITLFLQLSNRREKLLALIDETVFHCSGVPKAWYLPNVRSSGIVLTDALTAGAFLARAFAFINGLTFIIRLRGDFVTEQTQIAATEPIPRRLLRLAKLRLQVLLLKTAHGVICNSSFLKKRVEELVSGIRVWVVQNPVTVHQFKPVDRSKGRRGNAFRLISISNFEALGKTSALARGIEWIGHSDFTKACPEGSTIEWDVFGIGQFVPLLKSAIERRMERQVPVTYMGFTPDPLLEIGNSDVFVHFSGLDAFPNVTMEAMSLGVPVIANPESGGTLEQIEDGVNGFVVSSPFEFGVAVRSYLKNENTRRNHGAVGRRRVEERWSVEVLKAKLSSVLEEVASMGSPREGSEEKWDL